MQVHRMLCTCCALSAECTPDHALSARVPSAALHCVWYCCSQRGKSWPTFAAMSTSGITSVSLSFSDVDSASHCCSRCEVSTSSGTFVLLAHGLASYATLWIVCWFNLLLPCTPDVIKFRALFENFSSFVVRVFRFIRLPVRSDELVDNRC